MAVWKGRLANYEVWINNVDHLPAHCHVFINRRNKKIDLVKLEIINPPPHKIPPSLRHQLTMVRDELLQAWEEVRICTPSGKI